MSLLPQVNAYHTDGKGQYDYFFAMANESAKQWSYWPALSTVNVADHDIISTNLFVAKYISTNSLNAQYISTTSIALSSQTLTADANGVYANGEQLATSTILQSTVSRWWAFPTGGNVNFQNFEILSTSSIQLDDVFISANANELLINGIPIVTSTAFATMSSITDWAYFEALSSINCGYSNTIQNCAGIELNNSLVTTGGANTIQVNGQNPVAVWSGYTATGNLSMGNNNINSVINLSAVTVNNASNVGQYVFTNIARVNHNLIALSTSYLTAVVISTLTTSSITSPLAVFNSTVTQSLNASTVLTSTLQTNTLRLNTLTTSNVVLSNATNSNTLTTTGSQLRYNGAVIQSGTQGDVSQWALYNAVGTVRSQQGYANQALECIGKSYFNGDVQFRQLTGSTTPTVEFDRSSAGAPYFKINTGEFRATGSINRFGNSNTYATQNYIYGGTTIDGGNAHGCSIGCLPVTIGVNTCRIDVLPIGILLTTPTTVGIIATSFSFNVTAFANLAAEAYLALAAGTYMTLEHGFQASGQNGIFVQCTARNDTCRLTLEFGGSVGPSVDYPNTPAKVNYHGENFYIKNITNAFAGGRWPLSKDVFIDSVSTLKFVNGVNFIAQNNSTIGITGGLALSTLTAYDVNAYNVSTVNLTVESVFTPPGIGAVTFYENITATKNIACYSNITAPYMATSTIYGTSGATIGGNLWLETPLVTATGNLRVTNTLYSDDARFTGQTTLSSIQQFVGQPVTFANTQTNMPNNVTISTLTVQTVNGLPYPVKNPITFIEQATAVTIYTTLAVPLATGFITLPFASRIWATVNTTFDNTGSGSADYIISEFFIINGVTYNSTSASIPARFSPTVPSSTGISVQVVTAELSAGTYSIGVYASPNVANTDLTAVHSDIVVTGGY